MHEPDNIWAFEHFQLRCLQDFQIRKEKKKNAGLSRWTYRGIIDMKCKNNFQANFLGKRFFACSDNIVTAKCHKNILGPKFTLLHKTSLHHCSFSVTNLSHYNCFQCTMLEWMGMSTVHGENCGPIISRMSADAQHLKQKQIIFRLSGQT